jgi:hypothetical protein
MSSIGLIFGFGTILTFMAALFAHQRNKQAFDLLLYTIFAFMMVAVSWVISYLTTYPTSIMHYPIQDALMAFIASLVWHSKKQLWALILMVVFLIQIGIVSMFLLVGSAETLYTFKVTYNLMFAVVLNVLFGAALVYIFKSMGSLNANND